jgi:hypothetical protein
MKGAYVPKALTPTGRAARLSSMAQPPSESWMPSTAAVVSLVPQERTGARRCYLTFSLSSQIGRAARDDRVDYADKYVKPERHKMVQFDAGKLREQPTGHQPEFAL